jgi:hypothetical protein
MKSCSLIISCKMAIIADSTKSDRGTAGNGFRSPEGDASPIAAQNGLMALAISPVDKATVPYTVGAVVRDDLLRFGNQARKRW